LGTALAWSLLQRGTEILYSSSRFSAEYVQGARERMEKSILVIDADKEQGRKLCDLLNAGQCSATLLFSTHKLEQCIKDIECQAIFWDVDTVPVDNRTVRDLTLKFPGVYFFCLSKHRFHPELKDAICYHIYACLNRPIDQDELFFWLRSIGENKANSSKTSTH
jgi:DNA-binding NtrC family response regulator